MALSKNTIKYVKSLHQKKFRQKYNNFIVEGDKIVRELLSQTAFEIEGLYALQEWLVENEKNIQLPSSQIHLCSPTDLDRISTLKTPNQVLLIVHIPSESHSTDKINEALSLYLDDIRDPGNMGTIIRIADWFGISNVFYSSTSVEWTNPKVIQSTMGSFLRVRVQEMELADLRDSSPGVAIYGAVLEGVSIHELSGANTGIIVIGNESRGISRENLGLLSHRITIPKSPSGGAESLNAAVATGIICASLTR